MCFFFGGLLYSFIEILWRGHTHWTMGLTGGAALLGIYAVNEKYKRLPLFYAAFAAAALSRRWSFSSGFLSTRFFACTFGITAICRLIFSGKSALCFRSPGFFYRSPPVTFATGFKFFFFARRYAKTPCKNAAAFSNQPSASLPSARPIPWPPVS